LEELNVASGLGSGRYVPISEHDAGLGQHFHCINNQIDRNWALRVVVSLPCGPKSLVSELGRGLRTKIQTHVVLPNIIRVGNDFRAGNVYKKLTRRHYLRTAEHLPSSEEIHHIPYVGAMKQEVRPPPLRPPHPSLLFQAAQVAADVINFRLIPRVTAAQRDLGR
jgi:hypothetical protein